MRDGRVTRDAILRIGSFVGTDLTQSGFLSIAGGAGNRSFAGQTNGQEQHHEQAEGPDGRNLADLLGEVKSGADVFEYLE